MPIISSSAVEIQATAWRIMFVSRRKYLATSILAKIRSTGTARHYVTKILEALQTELTRNVPVHHKSDPVPYLTEWSCHVWILLHAAWPIALQWLSISCTEQNLSLVAAYFLYMAAWQLNGIHEFRMLTRLGQRLGFLDGDKHERDLVTDAGSSKALASLLGTSMARPLYTLYLTYDPGQAPSLSWWLPVELGLYSIVLDFWFYTYHRACHEVSFLWRYHRTHHMIKHPNPMLSAYADIEQEIMELAIIPVLTWVTLRFIGLPMNFYSWWLCHEYVVFAETLGHSGLRTYAVAPSTVAWLLKLLGCELIIEDHDIHHRVGWRRSHNYGKQTRLWDVLYDTCGPRYESELSNVDWSQKVNMPLF